MPRPRDQALRRSQLIDAAARTVLALGATGTKLRDIAKAAGVTPASVLYYYADIHELFSAVFERSSAAYVLGREEAVAAVEDPVAQLRACIHAGVPWPGEREDSTRVLLELLPAAMRDKPLAERHREFFKRQVECYQQVLQRGADAGVFALTASAGELGRSFVALEDGYSWDLLMDAATAEEIEARLYAHARVVTGHPAFAPAPES